MDRREFLASSIKTAAGFAATPLVANSVEAKTNVSIHFDASRVLRRIPSDFTGLGFEISSVAVTGLLASSNQHYVNLVRNLGPEGILRIGGLTSDSAVFSEYGIPVSLPEGTVVNRRNLIDLRSFLDATGWMVIWGLNLSSGDIGEAVTEAEAVSSIIGDRLHSFEIGNEPDHFGYPSYLASFRRYKAEVRKRLPASRFSGPDVAGATDWVDSFSQDEGADLAMLTEHYYVANGRSKESTVGMMLQPNIKLASLLERLQAISTQWKVPYRICETNSFYNGGRPGVSDTFGSALWALDYMFTLCSSGAAGVNIETGLNQYGVVSNYSPITNDGQGHITAMPEYYGMLTFAQACKGDQVITKVEPGDLNLTAYAVAESERQVVVTIINKDQSKNAQVNLAADRKIKKASVIYLSAPSVESSGRITLGGTTVATNGHWSPSKLDRVDVSRGMADLEVVSTSAALVMVAL